MKPLSSTSRSSGKGETNGTNKERCTPTDDELQEMYAQPMKKKGAKTKSVKNKGAKNEGAKHEDVKNVGAKIEGVKNEGVKNEGANNEDMKLEGVKIESKAENESRRSSQPTEDELSEMYAQPIKKKKRDVNKE